MKLVTVSQDQLREAILFAVTHHVDKGLRIEQRRARYMLHYDGELNAIVDKYLAHAVSEEPMKAFNKNGQQKMLTSDLLPKDIRDYEYFDIHGVEFKAEARGEARDDDDEPLFRHAVLPKGWTRKPGKDTEHVYLTDEEGTIHGVIYYDANHKTARLSMY